MPFVSSYSETAGPPEVFRTYPEIYGRWSEMSELLMNGPGELSSAERELLFTYAAATAGCRFVTRAHAAVATAWGIDAVRVQAVLEDPETAGLDARLLPLFRFVAKLVEAPASVSQADADAIFAAGWSEDSYHCVVAIVGRMRFMQALAEGYGFAPFTPEHAAAHAQKRVARGYVNLYPFFEKG